VVIVMGCCGVPGSCSGSSSSRSSSSSSSREKSNSGRSSYGRCQVLLVMAGGSGST
jgi:hypothetical protein